MRKLLVTLGLATAGGSMAFGAAANLQVSSQDLGSGFALVESCDPDGVTVSYNMQADKPRLVDSITVSDVHADCVGQNLSWVIQLEGPEGTRTITGDSTIGGEVNEVDLNGTVRGGSVVGVGLTIAGPSAPEVPEALRS